MTEEERAELRDHAEGVRACAERFADVVRAASVAGLTVRFGRDFLHWLRSDGKRDVEGCIVGLDLERVERL